MDIGSVLQQMAVLFIILILGYLLNRLKALPPETNRVLSKILLTICMPATILGSVIGKEISMSTSTVLLFAGLTLLTYILYFVVVWPIPPLLKADRENLGVYRFMGIFGNVGFMGFAITEAVFRGAAGFHVTIVYMFINFTIGIIMLTGGKGKLDPKLFLNAPLISGIVAVLLFIIRPPIPTVVGDTVSMLSKLTAPLGMLIIGSSLATMPLRDVFNDWRVYVLLAFKLLILPALVFVLLKLLRTDPFLIGVSVLMAGMPVATNITVLSTIYGGNEKLGSKSVFISTLLSAGTIPLLVYLFL